MIDDEVVESVTRRLNSPNPFFKCERCGADIKLSNPRSTIRCEYKPNERFEQALQRQQENPKVPVATFWWENRKKFALYRIRLICVNGCGRAQTQLLSDAEWFGGNSDTQWQSDIKPGLRLRNKLLRAWADE